MRGFKRLSLDPGESRRVQFEMTEDGLSEVKDDGSRAVLPGKYGISLGGSLPGPGFNGLKTAFTITGSKALLN